MAKKIVRVVGHKNPDTDSICAAIAYANLKSHTEIIMAKVDIITVTMVTDQPVREITEARDQTAETRDRSTTEDRDRDSIRETAAEDAIITSAEEIMVED